MAMLAREDIVAAQDRAWVRLAQPGRWWTGPERVQIAAEARHAAGCRLCTRRKAALSPYAVAGEHDQLAHLPSLVVEAIHRIRTDPGRITKAWYDGLIDHGLAAERYVEAAGVVVTTVAVDTFTRGLGLPLRPLPTPEPGEPNRKRPVGAKHGGAWVPWLEAADVTEDEAWLYYGRQPANIRKALSLVPEEAKGFFDLVEAMYLPGPAMRDYGREFRAITHAQIELLAGRVSAINRCEY